MLFPIASRTPSVATLLSTIYLDKSSIVFLAKTISIAISSESPESTIAFILSSLDKPLRFLFCNCSIILFARVSSPVASN